MSDYQKFKNLTYHDFKNLAGNPELSLYEKIGFPVNYRKGYEDKIIKDLCRKIPELNKKNKTILDIGCGCSPLTLKMIALAGKKNHNLLLADSPEMLNLLDDDKAVRKIPGRFPANIDALVQFSGKIDIIIVYSVLQHVFIDSNLFSFIDRALDLLSAGGKLFLGDIPNISKRKRFFSSEKGQKFHQKFMKSREKPQVNFLGIEFNAFDDSIIFSIMQRYRNFGFETYILSQAENLPMANRREDILIAKY
jgi:hypothetical protein